MKRVFFLTFCATIFWCFQILLNCSSPLESSGGGVPSPPTPSETVFVHDTVFLTDSTCDSIADTIYDTTIVIDTVQDTIIDTIYIPGEDSCDFSPSCAEFNKHNKKIHWKLHNDAGLHHLEFAATFGEECFDQILHIHIKGQKYIWDPVVSPVFTLDTELRKNAKIMIHCKRVKNDDDGGDRLSSSDHDDDCNDDDDGDDDDDDDDNGHKCCNVEVCLKVTKL